MSPNLPTWQRPKITGHQPHHQQTVKLGYNKQLGNGHFVRYNRISVCLVKWPICPENLFVITDCSLTTEFVITVCLLTTEFVITKCSLTTEFVITEFHCLCYHLVLSLFLLFYVKFSIGMNKIWNLNLNVGRTSVSSVSKIFSQNFFFLSLCQFRQQFMRSFFCKKSFMCSFFVLEVLLYHFWRKKIDGEADLKMLVKLTIGNKMFEVRFSIHFIIDYLLLWVRCWFW
jgi:hypothetical protein